MDKVEYRVTEIVMREIERPLSAWTRCYAVRLQPEIGRPHEQEDRGYVPDEQGYVWFDGLLPAFDFPVSTAEQARWFGSLIGKRVNLHVLHEGLHMPEGSR